MCPVFHRIIHGLRNRYAPSSMLSFHIWIAVPSTFQAWDYLYTAGIPALSLLHVSILRSLGSQRCASAPDEHPGQYKLLAHCTVSRWVMVCPRPVLSSLHPRMMCTVGSVRW